MNKFHEVQKLKADTTHLYLTVDEQSYRIPWNQCSSRLAHAAHRQRLVVEVSPSGYGLHWPLIDEDLALTPLLQQAERLSKITIQSDNLWVISTSAVTALAPTG